MLVLSRKVSESLLIGSDVRVTVLKVERNHVRIGIEAPGEVTILRAELVEERNDPHALAGNWDRSVRSAATR
jgi:carbon storage regulator